MLEDTNIDMIMSTLIGSTQLKPTKRSTNYMPEDLQLLQVLGVGMEMNGRDISRTNRFYFLYYGIISYHFRI